MNAEIAWIAARPVIPTPEKLAEMGIRLGIIVAVAFLAQRIVFLGIGRGERFWVRAGEHRPQSVQRARTLGQIFRSFTTFVVAGVAFVNALAVLGWNVSPLLAGAGILGVALGFGAQTLVRDVIAGFFILTENQFGVGDVVEIDGKAATVEALSVRCTTLRDFNGYVHFVPNGEMKVVTNRSREWNRLALDVLVAADEDLDRALELCRSVVAELNADPRWNGRLLDPVEVWGVESLGGAENQIRMVVRTRPGADGPEVARELRRRVHHALVTAGVGTTTSRELSLAGPGPASPTRPPGGEG